MASIDKRSGGYRVRHRDPLGRQRSRTFRRKADADRFARKIEIDKDPGDRIDPRNAETPLSVWAETFMLLARSLAPTTQETYRRDLDRYVLPKLGARRLGRLTAEEIEHWLNDELASGLAASSVHRHYRTLQPVRPCAAAEGYGEGRWSFSAGRNPWRLQRPTPTATGRSSTLRSSPGCGGASSPACAAITSISRAGRCASPSNSCSWPTVRVCDESQRRRRGSGRSLSQQPSPRSLSDTSVPMAAHHLGRALSPASTPTGSARLPARYLTSTIQFRSRRRGLLLSARDLLGSFIAQLGAAADSPKTRVTVSHVTVLESTPAVIDLLTASVPAGRASRRAPGSNIAAGQELPVRRL